MPHMQAGCWTRRPTPHMPQGQICNVPQTMMTTWKNKRAWGQGRGRGSCSSNNNNNNNTNNTYNNNNNSNGSSSNCTLCMTNNPNRKSVDA